MILHDSESLFKKWSDKESSIIERISVLKDRRLNGIYVESELEELYVKLGLIREFLSDVGIMVYVKNN